MTEITRTYLSGCTWCNATGSKFPMQHGGTDFPSICPVCNGSKTVIVTETTEEEVKIENRIKKLENRITSLEEILKSNLIRKKDYNNISPYDLSSHPRKRKQP